MTERVDYYERFPQSGYLINKLREWVRQVLDFTAYRWKAAAGHFITGRWWLYDYERFLRSEYFLTRRSVLKGGGRMILPKGDDYMITRGFYDLNISWPAAECWKAAAGDITSPKGWYPMKVKVVPIKIWRYRSESHGMIGRDSVKKFYMSGDQSDGIISKLSDLNSNGTELFPMA
jgi:hypothetical protein